MSDDDDDKLDKINNPLLPMWTNLSSKPDGIGYALLKVELF